MIVSVWIVGAIQQRKASVKSRQSSRKFQVIDVAVSIPVRKQGRYVDTTPDQLSRWLGRE